MSKCIVIALLLWELLLYLECSFFLHSTNNMHPMCQARQVWNNPVSKGKIGLAMALKYMCRCTQIHSCNAWQHTLPIRHCSLEGGRPCPASDTHTCPRFRYKFSASLWGLDSFWSGSWGGAPEGSWTVSPSSCWNVYLWHHTCMYVP